MKPPPALGAFPLAFALLAAGPATAQDNDALRDTLRVHARVVAQCVIHADDLDFGVYSSTGGSDATAFVSIRCTPGVNALVALNGGESGNVQARRMSGPSVLSYQLYRDPGRRTVFGDRRVDQMTAIQTNGAWQRIPVYGRAPSGQQPKAGAYRDVVSATIAY